MFEVAEELLSIDTRLRLVLFGLECALGVNLSPAEAERTFRESTENQVDAKDYTFHDSPRLRITGHVDEYEPETIWLGIEGRRGVAERLRRAIDGANSLAFRLQSAQESDQGTP